MDRKKLKVLLALHILMLIYSFSGFFSKNASKQDFLSIKFILFYAGMIAILGIYAVGWQQIIKRMPLGAAFANKAVTIVWGMLWGALFFSERITAGKVLGAVLVIAGVGLYALEPSSEESAPDGDKPGEGSIDE